MSDSPVPGTLELAEVLERRIDALMDWLAKENSGAMGKQGQLDSGTPERLYWHYGYYMALRDILEMLPRGRGQY
jgi:hypothetical protein